MCVFIGLECLERGDMHREVRGQAGTSRLPSEAAANDSQRFFASQTNQMVRFLFFLFFEKTFSDFFCPSFYSCQQTQTMNVDNWPSHKPGSRASTPHINRIYLAAGK